MFFDRFYRLHVMIRCALRSAVRPKSHPAIELLAAVLVGVASLSVSAQQRSSAVAAPSNGTPTSDAAGASSSTTLPRFAAPSEQFSFGPKEQTQLDITVSASADVNVDEKGRAAPILVRIYELKSETLFDSADYFSLQSGDKALLGGDLLTREEFIFRPGDVKTIRRKSHPDLAVIAVLAGYRELARSDWRATQRIEPAPEAAWYRSVLPANKTKLLIKLQAHDVRITAVE